MYCSGFVSDPKVPDDIRIISGEQSNYKIIFARGDYVYINRGEDKGVKIGDRYTIVRPDTDPANEWFYGQPKLLKEMGTLYKDAGQVRVVNVQPKVSIAEIVALLRLHATRRYRAAVRGAPGSALQGRSEIRSLRADQRETRGDGGICV